MRLRWTEQWFGNQGSAATAMYLVQTCNLMPRQLGSRNTSTSIVLYPACRIKHAAEYSFIWWSCVKTVGQLTGDIVTCIVCNWTIGVSWWLLVVSVLRCENQDVCGRDWMARHALWCCRCGWGLGCCFELFRNQLQLWCILGDQPNVTRVSSFFVLLGELCWCWWHVPMDSDPTRFFRERSLYECLFMLWSLWLVWLLRFCVMGM